MFDRENQRLIRFFFRRERRRKIKKRYQRMARSYHAANPRDFAWSKPRYQRHMPTQQSRPWQLRIKVILLTVFLLSTIGILVYHPFFHIKNVHVEGSQRISKTELENAAIGIMQDDKFLFIFPRKNYFLVNVTEIRDILKDRFSLLSIRVTKTFPHSLEIEVEEKLSTIIYDNGAYYAYLGLDGRIVEQIRRVGEDEWTSITKTVTSTNESGEVVQEEKVIERYHTPHAQSVQAEVGDFPVAYDKTAVDKTGAVNEQVLESTYAKRIIEWFTAIDSETDLVFSYLVIDNGLGDARIITKEGWEVRIQLSQDTSPQFERLTYLLKQKISSTANLQYIDVRYQDRLYWQ